MNKLKIIFAGVEDSIAERLLSSLNQYELTSIKLSSDFEQKLETVNDANTDLIICGPSISGVPSIELAQAFRMQATKSPIMYVSAQDKTEDPALLHKNGFDNVFFLPLDQSLLDQTLRKYENTVTGTKQAVFEAVPVMDIEPDSEIEFEVSIYMPLNKKYVKVMKPGHKVQKKQIEKLHTHNVNSIYVNENELPKFYSYAAQQLKSRHASAGSNLEVKKKLQSNVRNMFHSLITTSEVSFEAGRDLAEKSQKIIEELVGTKKIYDISRELSKLIGGDQGDQYAQSTRVSTYASLMSLGTNKGKPEELAIAGLFCDIGLTKLPQDLVKKSWSEMTPDEQKEYAKHPAESLRLLQEKRMVILPSVQEIILNHHEKLDGSGFPKGLNELKISESTQILQVALRFDELTVTVPGQKRLTPIEALTQIESERIATPALLRAIKEIFNPSKSTEKSAS